MIKSILYAGHSAVFLEGNDAVIAVDPWLAGNPACPKALVTPEKLDLICLTHGHGDHAGDAVRLVKRYNCTVIAVFELANLLIADGVPRGNVIPMGKGGSINWQGYTITLTQAVHSSSYTLQNGETEYAGEACGFIINDGARTFYHAGDTAAFSDMSLIKDIYHPNLAFLPIGDHFTMGPTAAAKAAVMIGAGQVMPIHYATFPALTGTPDEFIKELQKLGSNCEAVIKKPGERFQLI